MLFSRPRFYSLSGQAWHLRCSRLMVADNVFVSAQDASFDVRFGFADFQGNTFLGLTGRPFAKLRPAEPKVRCMSCFLDLKKLSPTKIHVT